MRESCRQNRERETLERKLGGSRERLDGNWENIDEREMTEFNYHLKHAIL